MPPPPAADIAATAAPHSPDFQAIPPRRHEIWPEAVIAFALGVNAAWVILLGYGVVELVEFVI